MPWPADHVSELPREGPLIEEQVEERTVEPARTAPAVTADALVKVYKGGKRAVDGVGFALRPGEIFGFLGPNGSGKTTTVRMLVTLLTITEGGATVGGYDVRREQQKVREILGYAGQFTGLDDDMTAHENLAIAGVLHDMSPSDVLRRASELLEEFALTEVENNRAGRLSGGLRRRLDLAQALMHRPPVLFLDEPTTGLDLQSRTALWSRLRALSREGTTIFLTTQYLEEADRICDRIAIIDHGRIVTVGTPRELKEQVGGGRVMVKLADPADADAAAAALDGLDGVGRVEAGQPLAAAVRDPGAAVAPIVRRLDTAGIAVAAVEIAQSSIDDVFLHFTGSRIRDEAKVEGVVSSIFAAVHGKRGR